jgi:hypothetical protein
LSGDITFNSVTVNNNLTVQQNTTLVGLVDVQQKTITLNSAETNTDPALGVGGNSPASAGIVIDRGSASQAATLLWNEQDDYWTLGNGTQSIQANTFIGDLDADNATISGNTTTLNLSVTNLATLARVDINDGNIDGTTIGSAAPANITGLTVTANTGFTGNITSSGTSSFATVTASGTVTSIGGFVGPLTGVVTVNSGSTITGTSINNSPIGATTPNTIIGTTIEGTTITATTGFTGNIDSNGTSTFNNITQDTSGIANLYTVNVAGDLTMSAGTTANFANINVSGTVAFTNLTVNQALDVGGDFSIGDTTGDDPEFFVNATTGAVTIKGSAGTLNVAGATTLQNNLAVQGNTTLGNANTDTITTTGKFNSDILVTTDGAYDLGDNTNRFRAVFADAATFTDNVTIGGNLTITGATTTLLTEEINLADNIIVLNSNETGTPGQNSGIEIERGTEPNKQFIWNETDDYWTVGSSEKWLLEHLEEI